MRGRFVLVALFLLSLVGSGEALSESGLELGLDLSGNGSLAKLPASDTSSGLGYGVSVEAYFSCTDRIRLVPHLGLQVLSLTRVVDGSGSLVDTPAALTQTYSDLSLGALVGFNLARHGLPGEPGYLAWWLDGGAELLWPVSAVQSDNFGGRQQLSPEGRALLLSLGPSVEFGILPRLNLGGSFQLAYNLFSASGYAFFNARLGGGVQYLL